MEKMEKLNKDEIYLICKKLSLKSTLNFSLTNKKLRGVILLHNSLLKEKLRCPERCHLMLFQIHFKVNLLSEGLSKVR